MVQKGTGVVFVARGVRGERGGCPFGATPSPQPTTAAIYKSLENLFDQDSNAWRTPDSLLTSMRPECHTVGLEIAQLDKENCRSSCNDAAPWTTWQNLSGKTRFRSYEVVTSDDRDVAGRDR